MSEHRAADNGRRVGAVIVNYNSGPHLAECVRSLRGEGVVEVVVVDNGSTDGSVDLLCSRDPEVTVIEAGRNLGYGTGANRGLQAGESELVLVSNPDVSVRPGALAALVGAIDRHPQVGVVGPRIEDPDGRLYPSARSFPSLADAAGHGFVGLVAPGNRFSRRYRQLDRDHSEARAVDWVSGACFLAKRSVLSSLGGFDERYFMFCEDVDLCWRAGRAGWRIGYEPAGVVTHVQGVSTRAHPYRMIVTHHWSLLRFAARTRPGRRRVVLPAVAAGLAARAGLVCLLHAIAAYLGPALDRGEGWVLRRLRPRPRPGGEGAGACSRAPRPAQGRGGAKTSPRHGNARPVG